MFTIRSCCLRAAFNPANKSTLNSAYKSDSGPPITSTNSGVNLNGDCSKPVNKVELNNEVFKKHFKNKLPKFFGDILRINPKSI